MKYTKFFILFVLITFLSGCADEKFTPIDHHQSFIATMNILEPSLNFYDADSEIATWHFEKAYTGAMFLEHDRVLLYGHQLKDADIYELSSGKIIKTIFTDVGTTNAYYDKEKKMFFLSNSERNVVTSYDDKGNRIKEVTLKNYPMSMASNNGLLYVINYKDTFLSVVDIDTLTVKDEWEIEKSSNGIMIIPEEKAIWIGGHGKGDKPNQTIVVLNMDTGEKINEIPTSLMPVEFYRQANTIYTVNHGSNELCAFNVKGNLLWKKEVGANPFSVNTFQGYIVVAGFDDHHLYLLKDNKIVKTYDTEKGPFKVLVREANR